MAEYWTGKDWVSDEGKSVADMIDIPKIYKGSQGKGQMYATILPRAISNPQFKEIEPKYEKTFESSSFIYEDLDVHVLYNRRGHCIVYHGEPRNYYPQYFLLNE